MISPDPVDLTHYDLILLNTSAGKDSSVAVWYVTALAEAFGVKDRLVLVHATFEEEWPDAEKVAREQAEQLGVPIQVVSRGEELLTYVERRGKWPDSKNRYCTSDFKRAPIDKVLTARVARILGSRHTLGRLGRRVRVLNVMGIRAQESPARAKRAAFTRDLRRTNGRRIVDEWLPIFRLSTTDVWEVIRAHSIPTHRAYALGFTRLSCRICIFASRDTLLAAAWEHPGLFKRYVDVEAKIQHKFRMTQTLADVWTSYTNGERPRGPLTFDKGL